MGGLMHTRLLLAATIVAVIGLSSALWIYFTARDDDEPDEYVQIVVVDGKTYRIPLADTKIYRRDLQRFGGTAAVLADDFRRWCAGLWRGRSLAVTIGVLTVVLAALLLLLARLIALASELGERGEDNGFDRGTGPPAR